MGWARTCSRMPKPSLAAASDSASLPISLYTSPKQLKQEATKLLRSPTGPGSCLAASRQLVASCSASLARPSSTSASACMVVAVITGLLLAGWLICW
jgi:hypothetical protein